MAEEISSQEVEVLCLEKRRFILQSDQMSDNRDLLEYYKNEHSKKPLRIIGLNFCEQMASGLTFTMKEVQEALDSSTELGNHCNNQLPQDVASTPAFSGSPGG
ncbi:GRB2-associated-binding protein 2 [Microtus ochrogaster]|uniref:GRB2-associated-binding protein 2 n=1 Tax=Microtus ochrogaster TaxID=79684 RepID=A0A8J6G9J8_MICOH|nr:GRB2-associated-binding protein 2 [Microtus ochrogaster]